MIIERVFIPKRGGMGLKAIIKNDDGLTEYVIVEPELAEQAIVEHLNGKSELKQKGRQRMRRIVLTLHN